MTSDSRCRVPHRPQAKTLRQVLGRETWAGTRSTVPRVVLVRGVAAFPSCAGTVRHLLWGFLDARLSQN
jgi:hypothetical protein